MKSASESLQQIVDDMKALKRLEASESAVNSNKGFVGAEHGKRVKRDAPEHTPIDAPRIETAFTVAASMLHGVSRVIHARRADAERKLAGIPTAIALRDRRKAALEQPDTSPIEVALLYGYTSDKSVRELRARNGLDEATGLRLRPEQRPIVSPNRKRVR